MAIAEMLDELKQKALHDPKLKEARWQPERKTSLLRHSAESAGSWGMRFMRWISSLPEKKPMRPCVEAPTAAERTPRCWRARMISTNCSLQDFKSNEPLTRVQPCPILKWIMHWRNDTWQIYVKR